MAVGRDGQNLIWAERDESGKTRLDSQMTLPVGREHAGMSRQPLE